MYLTPQLEFSHVLCDYNVSKCLKCAEGPLGCYNMAHIRDHVFWKEWIHFQQSTTLYKDFNSLESYVLNIKFKC
jgi:hypothetical protein